MRKESDNTTMKHIYKNQSWMLKWERYWKYTVKWNSKNKIVRSLWKYLYYYLSRGRFIQEQIQQSIKLVLCLKVTEMTTIKMILEAGNEFCQFFYQIDVTTTFLNGILWEDVYMKIPDSFKKYRNKVRKLKKYCLAKNNFRSREDKYLKISY